MGQLNSLLQTLHQEAKQVGSNLGMAQSKKCQIPCLFQVKSWN